MRHKMGPDPNVTCASHIATRYAISQRRIVALLLASLFTGCNEPSDACTEAHNVLSKPATGTLEVTYSGRFGVAPSKSFSPYVFISRPSFIEVSGCALDGKNDLWRFWSEWAFPATTSFPTEVRVTPDLASALDTNVPGFWGNFLKCHDNNCADRMENILQVFGSNDRPQGSGFVDAFDIESGWFLAFAPLTSDGGETLRIKVNINWRPSVFTFPDAGPDAESPDPSGDGGL
jgi:hypothetical protein